MCWIIQPVKTGEEWNCLSFLNVKKTFCQFSMFWLLTQHTNIIIILSSFKKKRKKKDWEGAWVVVKWTDRWMVAITWKCHGIYVGDSWNLGESDALCSLIAARRSMKAWIGKQCQHFEEWSGFLIENKGDKDAHQIQHRKIFLGKRNWRKYVCSKIWEEGRELTVKGFTCLVNGLRLYYLGVGTPKGLRGSMPGGLI